MDVKARTVRHPVTLHVVLLEMLECVSPSVARTDDASHSITFDIATSFQASWFCSSCSSLFIMIRL